MYSPLQTAAVGSHPCLCLWGNCLLTFGVTVVQRDSADLHEDLAFAGGGDGALPEVQRVESLQGGHPLFYGHDARE